MKSLLPNYLFAIFCVFSFVALGQSDEENVPLRKIDLNLSFNMIGKTNYSKEDAKEERIGATSVQFTIYPLDYKKIQFGLGFGLEFINIRLLDTMDIAEDRIPLMVVSKFNFISSNTLYLKTQLGTAVTLKSEYVKEGASSIINDRTEIGTPVLASISLGAVMPIEPVTIGLELGYAYKQTGYKHENRYNKGAVFLSVIGSFR